MKYKTHSLISAICLAVGIVCYALVCFFVQQQEKLADLPNCERRLRIEVDQSESPFFRSHEVKRMEEQTVDGLECVAIHSYGNSTEIEVIDDEQRNLPFLIKTAKRSVPLLQNKMRVLAIVNTKRNVYFHLISDAFK